MYQSLQLSVPAAGGADEGVGSEGDEVGVGIVDGGELDVDVAAESVKPMKSALSRSVKSIELTFVAFPISR